MTKSEEFFIEIPYSSPKVTDEVEVEGEDCDEFDFHPNALPSRPIMKTKIVTVNLSSVDNEGKETNEGQTRAYSKHFPLIYSWVRAKITFTEPLNDNLAIKLVEQGHFKVTEYSLNNKQGQGILNLFFTSICDLIKERNVKNGSEANQDFLRRHRSELGDYLKNRVPDGRCFLGKIQFLNKQNNYQSSIWGLVSLVYILFEACDYSLTKD